MSHTLKHLIGCIGPLLLIFLLPLFGVSEGIALFAFIVLMFACHLFMMRGHEHGGSHTPDGEGGTHHHHP